VDRLMAFAEFNPNYLHLKRRRDNEASGRAGTETHALRHSSVSPVVPTPER
jgi:hypothetical protein